MSTSAITKYPREVQAARDTLRRKGWTVTAAAEEFQVGRVHLSKVLTARRQSKRLLRAIHDLPDNPNPA